jgi:hypothetical protein
MREEQICSISNGNFNAVQVLVDTQGAEQFRPQG